MVSGGFFTGSERRDDRIAGNLGPSTPIKNYGGNMGFSQDFGAGRVKNVRPKPGFGLKDIYGDGTPRAQFFNPRGQEVGQIASASTNLSGLSEDDNYKAYMKAAGIKYPRTLSDQFHRMFRQNMKDDIRDGRFKDGQLINRTPQQNTLQKVGNFLANALTGSRPVAAGTLDDAPSRFAGEADPTPRPKLSYVDPDQKIMNFSQIKDSFKPSNLFGINRNEIGGKFGTYDAPGSPLARDRQETIDRVKRQFTTPNTPDARSIAQIRADQKAAMRESARIKNEAFKRGDTPQRKSADDTFGTNMMSNPAFGFRSRMTNQDKASYDRSAAIATERAKPDPSLGNVITSAANLAKRGVNAITGGTPLTKEKSLESIGERQLRLANKEINRPTYQKEAYARKVLGITNDQLKAQNLQRIRENAAARNQAFQADKLARAVERAAQTLGNNRGTGTTQGKGMSSNPAGQRQTGVGESANNLSRHKAGRSTGTTSTSSGGMSKSGRKSRSGSKSSSRGASGGSSSRSRGGTGSGRTSTSRRASSASRSRTGRSRSQCDIRTKIDIAPLTNTNLLKDELAVISYFVQGIK